MPKFSVSQFWNQVRKHRVSVATLLAPIPLFLFNQPQRYDDSKNPLRMITTAPMPSFWQSFERRFNVKLVTAFGQTEVGHPIMAQIHEPHRDNTTGKPCRHFELCIVDEWDEMLPAGVVGEILVRPKRPFTTMTGYYKDPQATSKASRNLWHHTGDLGVAREDGYLTYVGRIKDAIRRRSENISSLEVEEVLLAHPDVVEAAVVGVPSDQFDEEVKAVIVLAPGSECGSERVATWTHGKLARYAIPRFIEFVPELPHTETNKVKKTKLREKWRNKRTYDLAAGRYLDP